MLKEKIGIKNTIAALTVSALMLPSIDAFAWKQDTHRQIVVDAVNYMRANPDSTEYHRLASATPYLDNVRLESLGLGVMGCGLLLQ